MICWMFPGQPITFPEISATDPEFRQISELCRSITGFDPSAPADSRGMQESVRLQLSGTAMSLYHAALSGKTGEKPDMIAEHSMGIYPALAASGSIEPATALELTWRIGTRMAQMGETREYALACVTGLQSGTLQAIAANSGAYIANCNTSRHFLLAGEKSAIDVAVKDAAAAGAFSASTFPCDAPLHTPLLCEIAGDLRRIVEDYDFKEPHVPLVEHIDQTLLSAVQIPAFLVDELCKPVFWDKTYLALCAKGISDFREMGHPRVLAKFNRWIDSEK